MFCVWLPKSVSILKVENAYIWYFSGCFANFGCFTMKTIFLVIMLCDLRLSLDFWAVNMMYFVISFALALQLAHSPLHSTSSTDQSSLVFRGKVMFCLTLNSFSPPKEKTYGATFQYKYKVRILISAFNVSTLI